MTGSVSPNVSCKIRDKPRIVVCRNPADSATRARSNAQLAPEPAQRNAGYAGAGESGAGYRFTLIAPARCLACQ